MPYRRSLEGRALRAFYNANERSKKEGYNYSTGDVLSKEEFLEFVKNNDSYKKLYNEWEESGFNYGLTPTLDRINSNDGYNKNNIQFLTFSDNARKNHDRESFKDIREEKYINGRGIMNKYSRLLLGEFEEEKEKTASLKTSEENIADINSLFSIVHEENRKISKYNHGYDMVKAANFSLTGDGYKINNEAMIGCIEDRFDRTDIMVKAGSYNDTEGMFIKLGYLSIVSSDIPDDEKTRLILIQDKSFFSTNHNNYNFLDCCENDKTASDEGIGEEYNASEILTDKVMSMIREEMGDEVADNLNNNRENVFNALPLPYKQQIKGMYDDQEGEELGSKTASALLTLGLTGLGAGIGRSNMLSINGNKMDRADGMVAGGLGGALAGQIISDYQNGMTNKEMVTDNNGLPVTGMEGAALGTILGYNFSPDNKTRNSVIGGLGGAATAEILKRMM